MDRNPTMRYKRQELFDMTKKELIPIKMQDKDYFAYGNVNLSIFISPYCNGNCGFCVAQLRYFHEGVDYIKPLIKDDKEYYAKLEFMLDQVKPLNPSVSLTGGEPTLDKRLPTILKILDKHNVRKRTITTNGSGLLQKVDNCNDTILDRLIDYKLQHLNISRAHYDEEKNNQIMKLNEPYFSNKDLEKVVTIAKANGIRPRLSCVLLNGEIDSIHEMKRYMDWAENIGVDNAVFRQLMAFDKKAVKPGNVPEYCINKSVNLIPLWEQIDHDNQFNFAAQVLGYYYYVEVFNYKNIAMVSEMADLNLIEAEKENTLKKTNGIPVIYELVFHPNGTLGGSWREWNEIILK